MKKVSYFDDLSSFNIHNIIIFDVDRTFGPYLLKEVERKDYSTGYVWFSLNYIHGRWNNSSSSIAEAIQRVSSSGTVYVFDSLEELGEWLVKRNKVDEVEDEDIKEEEEVKPAKFKVGDKVRVIGHQGFHRYSLGQVVTIKSIAAGSYFCEDDRHHTHQYLREADIKLVSSPAEPKFKVGDRVRVKTGLEVNKRYDDMNFFVKSMEGYEGKAFVITSVDKYGYLLNTDECWHWTPSMLEPAPIEKFKVGDRVRVRIDLEINKEYGEDAFIDHMAQYKGQIFTITGVKRLGAHKLGDIPYNWTDEMLEPAPIEEFKVGDVVCLIKPSSISHAFEVGQPLEVIDDDDIYVQVKGYSKIRKEFCEQNIFKSELTHYAD